jgi:hypothetical protein
MSNAEVKTAGNPLRHSIFLGRYSSFESKFGCLLRPPWAVSRTIPFPRFTPQAASYPPYVVNGQLATSDGCSHTMLKTNGPHVVWGAVFWNHSPFPLSPGAAGPPVLSWNRGGSSNRPDASDGFRIDRCAWELDWPVGFERLSQAEPERYL